MSPSTLPPTFSFSQAALQSYSDCPRQFWLAWIRRLPWPASYVAPALESERRMRLGARFHRLVERVERGVVSDNAPFEGLDSPLDEWFEAWRLHRPAGLPDSIREYECTLSTPIDLGDAGRVRLLARFDLIAVEPGKRIVIVDWKTGDRPQSEPQMARRLQSVVYPYVMVEACAGLSWGPVAPDQLEMIYWFAAAPDRPVRIAYDAATHESNRRRLTELLADILSRIETEDFSLVADTPENLRRFCRYCVYRSHCDRGNAASIADLSEDDSLLDDVTTLPSLDDLEELAF